MILSAFLLVAFGSAVAALVARGYERISLTAGLGGLAGCLILALLMEDGATVQLAGGGLIGTPFLRLFLVLGSVGALLLCVVGGVSTWQANLPAAYLAGLGASAAALAMPFFPGAVLAVTAGGIAGVLAVTAGTGEGHGVRVAARYLRAVAGAGSLVLVASVWLVYPDGTIRVEPLATSFALVGMGTALAIRLGAIPFHAWAARVAETAPHAAGPLLLAWLPAALFLVALAWAREIVLPLGLDLSTEEGALVVLGVLSLTVGALGAWIQGDIEHVVGYSVVQDAGLFLMAFGGLGANLWEPARTWVLFFVLAKTALAAWAVSLRAVYGTSRLTELSGWVRRSPLLAVGLVAAVLVGLGLPGLASWEARLAIVDRASDGLLQGAAFTGWGLAYLPVIRLLLAGLRKPSETVAAATGQLPRWPAREPRVVGAIARAGRLAHIGLNAWRLNRLPAATTLTLALALLGLALALVPGPITAAAAGGPPGSLVSGATSGAP